VVSVPVALALIVVGEGVLGALALAAGLGPVRHALGGPRRWAAATALVVLVALAGSYGLIRALDVAGVLDYCGPATPWSPEC
jgi:hypothetical protein